MLMAGSTGSFTDRAGMIGGRFFSTSAFRRWAWSPCRCRHADSSRSGTAAHGDFCGLSL